MPPTATSQTPPTPRFRPPAPYHPPPPTHRTPHLDTPPPAGQSYAQA
ncbi:unnamed protein product [Coregonus sp. 'balchen']|nr:unnamed protein product [Coregonus sp. 'balchen']